MGNLSLFPTGANGGRKSTGSYADVPPDLMAQIERLEDLFTVDTEKCKEITNHFVKELEKGLSSEGGDIVSCSSNRQILR